MMISVLVLVCKNTGDFLRPKNGSITPTDAPPVYPAGTTLESLAQNHKVTFSESHLLVDAWIQTKQDHYQ